MVKKADPLKEWGTLLQSLTANVANTLNVASLARISSIQNNNIDVQLLAAVNGTPPVLHSVLCLDHITDLKVGDVVLLNYLDLPTDGFFHDGRVFEAKEKRRHSINDAVIVGRLQL